jgi:glyoxylase-like metal-dependent hydrolase (beta-lactamase superfamily II)
MGKWLRRLLWTVGILAALGAAGYYPLVVHSPAPGAPFALDIAQIRALADSVAGDKAVEVRYEDVMSMAFSEAMLMAGDPWRATEMPVYSYQLVFPDRTLIVDAALPREMAKPESIVMRFDNGAYQRMLAAMEKAEQIVVTHEHVDHIGGVAAHPQLARILPAVRLNAEQVANRFGMYPARFPDELMQNYQPLRYDGALAIAPGVVLIKSPGHTPGSQMVYVQRADGRELLLLGDVSWRLRNVEQVRERPLFMTLLIREDRQAVLGQFQALHELRQKEPGIALVPGHDGPAVQAHAAAGLLTAGFQ